MQLGSVVYALRRPVSKAVLTIRVLQASCLAYTDSLQNEQFILSHLHILHSSPLRRSRVPELSYPALTCTQGGRLSSIPDSSPNVVYALRRPVSKVVLTIRVLQASCRAYADSLQNEQFILSHLHILQEVQQQLFFCIIGILAILYLFVLMLDV